MSNIFVDSASNEPGSGSNLVSVRILPITYMRLSTNDVLGFDFIHRLDFIDMRFVGHGQMATNVQRGQT